MADAIEILIDDSDFVPAFAVIAGYCFTGETFDVIPDVH